MTSRRFHLNAIASLTNAVVYHPICNLVIFSCYEKYN